MIKLENTTGLILAGGAGRRVGGVDKGLMAWRGRPLIEQVVQRLRPQVGQLLISCNRSFEVYATLVKTIVADTRRDFQGPLAGLEAASPYIDTDFVVLVPCDNPLLPQDMASRLLQALVPGEGDGFDISYAHDGRQDQYLCAAMRSHCLTSLPHYLDEGHRAVRHWYQTQRCCTVDFSDQPENFINCNRLEETKKPRPE